MFLACTVDFDLPCHRWSVERSRQVSCKLPQFGLLYIMAFLDGV